MPKIAEALQLLGHGASQVEQAERLARQTATGGSRTRPESKAEQARRLKLLRPDASSQAIARAIDAASPTPNETDARHVRRTLAKLRKR